MKKETKEILKSLCFAVSALILLSIWLTLRPKPPVSTPKELVGKKLFAGFDDPSAVHSLEIVRLDSADGARKSIQITGTNGGSWKIENYFNYPAENVAQMTKVVTPFLQLTVQGLVDEPGENADSKRILEIYRSCHVVDPSGAAPEEKESAGILVRFLGPGGEMLVNAILGDRVPESSVQRDVRYLRIPGEDRVYLVDFSTEATADSGAELLQPMSDRLSTDPLDWINRDLLRISRWNILELAWLNVSVNESKDPVPGSYTAFSQTPEKAIRSVWALSKRQIPKDGKFIDSPSGGTPNADPINNAADALGHLNIVGLERLPENWTKALYEKDGLRTLRSTKQPIDLPGFEIANFDPLNVKSIDPSLIAKNGRIDLTMKDGVLLRIYFGEKKEEKIRVLIVPTLAPNLLKEPVPQTVKTIPEKADEKTRLAIENENKKIASENSIKKSDYELRLRDARQLLTELTARYSDWLYYISLDDWKKVSPPVETLVK